MSPNRILSSHSYQQTVGNANGGQTNGCASSLEYLHIIGTMSNKDIACKTGPFTFETDLPKFVQHSQRKNGFQRDATSENHYWVQQMHWCLSVLCTKRLERQWIFSKFCWCTKSFHDVNDSSIAPSNLRRCTSSYTNRVCQNCRLHRQMSVCKFVLSARLANKQRNMFRRDNWRRSVFVDRNLQTFPDDKGCVQTVSIRTKNGIVRRPIRLCASWPELHTIDTFLVTPTQLVASRVDLCGGLGCKMDSSFPETAKLRKETDPPLQAIAVDEPVAINNNGLPFSIRKCVRRCDCFGDN